MSSPYREAATRPPCPKNCGLPDEKMEPIPEDADIVTRLMMSGFSKCFTCGREQRLFNADHSKTTALTGRPK